MLPLICFNCGGVGHFFNKCPYKKIKRNEEEDDPKRRNKIQKGRRNKNIFFKKILCTNEDNSSSCEVNNNDTERLLFMELEDLDEEGPKEEYEEAEVDYREELISDIEVNKREKKTNKSLQEEVKKREESQNFNSKEVESMITKLKILGRRRKEY
jgi:hypothetical protein